MASKKVNLSKYMPKTNKQLVAEAKTKSIASSRPEKVANERNKAYREHEHNRLKTEITKLTKDRVYDTKAQAGAKKVQAREPIMQVVTGTYRRVENEKKNATKKK